MQILFDIKNKKIVSSSTYSYEKEMENFLSENLEKTFLIKFIDRQVSIDGNFMDILGIDKFNNICIIELKRETGSTVINQILHYYKLLIKNKKLIKEKYPKIEFDFDYVRLMCISADFTEREKSEIEVFPQINDYNIELYEYKKYKNNFLSFAFIGSSASNYYVQELIWSMSSKQRELFNLFYNNTKDFPASTFCRDGWWLDYRLNRKIDFSISPDGDSNLKIYFNENPSTLQNISEKYIINPNDSKKGTSILKIENKNDIILFFKTLKKIRPNYYK